jgi:hypothetical protein
VFAAFSNGRAFAAETEDPCLSAPIEGQEAERAGKLIEARASYIACSKNTCPEVIVTDCVHWLSEVEDALPSATFAARDAQGNDILDARVSIDGGPLASLTTLAVPVNPGQHRFTFHRDGAPDVEQQAILRAGEKNRSIVAVFVTPDDALRHPPSMPVMQPVMERPVPVAAWVAAGTGIVALGLFGVFGALGVSERGADGCATGCPPSEKTSVDTKFDVADVALGAAACSLGVAAWLYLARPTVPLKARTSASWSLRLTPGGGVLAGRF